jgi:hypothetical protein
MGRKARNGDSESGRTTETETTTETGNDIGREIDGGTTTEQGNIVDENLQVNLVIPEIPVPGEKKKRGRPVGWRKDAVEVETKTTTKTESGLDGNQIGALIQGVFSLISLKAGSEWQISTQETKLITDPLCRILERYDLATKVAEMSDGASLVIALITIFGGRVMITMSKKNHNEILKSEVKQNGNGNLGKQQGASTKENLSSNIREMPRRNPESSLNDGEYIKTITASTIGQY